MLRTNVFWLMFVMMTMMSTGGLMVISQFARFAQDFGVTQTMVLCGHGRTAARADDRPHHEWLDPAILRLGVGPYRPREHHGDRLPHGGPAVTLMLLSRDNPLLFVLLSGVVFFGWGEIFSLFPSTLTDTFGTKNATTNYGFLYMAQGVGSILGRPLAALLHDKQEAGCRCLQSSSRWMRDRPPRVICAQTGASVTLQNSRDTRTGRSLQPGR